MLLLLFDLLFIVYHPLYRNRYQQHPNPTQYSITSTVPFSAMSSQKVIAIVKPTVIIRLIVAIKNNIITRPLHHYQSASHEKLCHSFLTSIHTTHCLFSFIFNAYIIKNFFHSTSAFVPWLHAVVPKFRMCHF